MKQVLKQTAYANKYAARRKAELIAKKTAATRRQAANQRAQVLREHKIARKEARHAQRENWLLGELSPWREAGAVELKDAVAGATPDATDQRTRTAYPLRSSVPDTKCAMALAQGGRFGSYDMLAAYPISIPKHDRKWRNHWVRQGDRVCVVDGDPRFVGKIGVVSKKVNWGAEEVEIEGMNRVDIFVDKEQRLAYSHALAGRATITAEITFPISQVRLVYPLPDPNNNNIPRDCIIENIKLRHVPRYTDPEWKQKAKARIDEASIDIAQRRAGLRLNTGDVSRAEWDAVLDKREAEIDALQKEVEQLESMIKDFEWSPFKQNFRRYCGDIMIPWPEDAEEDRLGEGLVEAMDTVRLDVEEQTFVPTLLRPPMPETVIDELRNKYSRYRDRHDDDYIERKMAEDEEAESIEALKESMIPRGAKNVARGGSALGGRYLADDTIPVGHEDHLEAIGRWMEAKAAARREAASRPVIPPSSTPPSNLGTAEGVETSAPPSSCVPLPASATARTEEVTV